MNGGRKQMRAKLSWTFAGLMVAILGVVACIGLAACGGAPVESEASMETEASTEGENGEAMDDDAEAERSETPSSAATPVEVYGKLHVEGTALADAQGNPVQLRGVSTHGLAWFPQYVNSDAFRTLRDDWGANCVRLAMYTAESGGYCEDGNQESLEELVIQGVDAATEQGLYVIIDWHVLHDLTPLAHMDAAKTFFDVMSSMYAGSPNVLYEICNEPNGDTPWSDVKRYAEEVIPIIRSNDPDAVVIVGTPEWSQRVDAAVADPLTGEVGENVLYSLHFYAATHGQELRDRMTAALKAGLPIFISEFGTPDASGAGANDLDSADAWLDLADQWHVSYCCWSLSNKDEAASLLAPTSTATSDWSAEDLSEAGTWYRNRLRNAAGME